MNRTALAIFLIAVITLSVATWFVNNQISGLQNKVDALQLQNREKQDRLADFTYQLALERHLRVKITAFTWKGGFYPIAGLTLSHPITVTVQNDEVIPVSGLTLTFTLVNKNRGTQIGSSGARQIDRLNAEESREIGGAVYTILNTSLDDAVCVVTLTVGNSVLDQGTYSLN